MDLNLDILRMAQASASHAAQRQTLVANNIANADTPGFQARDTASFSSVFSQSKGNIAPRNTRPGHLLAAASPGGISMAKIVADKSGETSPNGNTVSLEHEMAKAVELRHDYDMALTIYRKSLDILKASLGR